MFIYISVILFIFSLLYLQRRTKRILKFVKLPPLCRLTRNYQWGNGSLCDGVTDTIIHLISFSSAHRLMSGRHSVETLYSHHPRNYWPSLWWSRRCPSLRPSCSFRCCSRYPMVCPWQHVLGDKSHYLPRLLPQPIPEGPPCSQHRRWWHNWRHNRWSIPRSAQHHPRYDHVHTFRLPRTISL